jgi:hypothetical protein
VLVGIVLIFRVTFVDQMMRPLKWSSRLMRSVAGYVSVGLLAWLFAYLNLTFWSDELFDFLVILLLLLLSAELFRIDPAVWDTQGVGQRRRRLYILVVVAVVCFAFEGSVFPESKVLMDGVVGRVVPAAVPVPQSLAALLVTVIIMIQSLGLIQESRAYAEMNSIDQQIAAYLHAAPLLLLVFCVETAVLPYIGPKWPEIVVPLAGIVAIVVLQALSRRIRGRHGRRRGAKWPKWLNALVAYPGLILFVFLYLIAYPVIVGAVSVSVSDSDRLALTAVGLPPPERPAFLLALGINVLYLILAGIVAGFGLDRVAVWATREAWGQWRERIFTLGRGLPILLVFTTFFLLTAEIWESMYKISTLNYLLLLGLVLGVTGAFHLITSLREFSRKTKFGSWSDVVAAASFDRRISGEDSVAEDPEDSEIQQLLNSIQVGDGEKVPTHDLRLLERINGLMVLMTYEILLFIPVMLIAAGLFYALGKLLVPPEIAATWIFGDGTPAERGYELARMALIKQPWIRVPGILAVFSVLYLAVEVLLDSDKNKEFFESADKAVRRRLAVRLAYHEALKYRLAAQLLYIDFLCTRWSHTAPTGGLQSMVAARGHK